MSQETGAPGQDLLERIIQGFQNHQVSHHLTVGGVAVRAMLEIHIATEKTLLGFSAPGLKLGSTEAGEYIFFVEEKQFTPATMDLVEQLLQTAEKRYLNMTKEHGYTFFSVVVLAEEVDRQSLGKWKRFKFRREYEYGWGLARLALVDRASLAVTCNGDGKELGKLVSAAMSNHV